MPRNNKTTGQQWKTCDRCGFDYPINQLKRQNSYWLCKEMCVDLPGRDYHVKQLTVEGELRGAEQEESVGDTFSDGE